MKIDVVMVLYSSGQQDIPKSVHAKVLKFYMLSGDDV